MIPSSRAFLQNLCMLGLLFVAGVVLVSCGPSSNTADQGPPYERAKNAFKSGKLTRALDLTETLAATTPPADATERAQVLRAVIFAGQLKSSLELSDAYAKGADKSKDSADHEVAYRRLQNDNLEIAEKAAMGLAQTSLQIAPGGVIAKELTLEASFPTTEGPTEIKDMAALEKGEWLEPAKIDSMAVDALNKGIDDALAEAVGGDRAKAQQALAGGSTKLDGAAFAIFLAKGLTDGAVVFDLHHGVNAQRLNIMCDQGEASLKAALALLKDTPNKDEDKEIKKLQDKFKTLRKGT